MEKALSATMDGENLVVSFPDDVKLIARPPGNIAEYQNWPKSFQDLIKHHESLKIVLEYNALYLGNLVSFIDDIEAEDSLDDVKADEWLGKGDVNVPITDVDGWWLFHPENMKLYYITHDGEIQESETLTIGALFLSCISQHFGIELPKTTVAKSDSQTIALTNSTILSDVDAGIVYSCISPDTKWFAIALTNSKILLYDSKNLELKGKVVLDDLKIQRIIVERVNMGFTEDGKHLLICDPKGYFLLDISKELDIVFKYRDDPGRNQSVFDKNTVYCLYKEEGINDERFAGIADLETLKEYTARTGDERYNFLSGPYNTIFTHPSAQPTGHKKWVTIERIYECKRMQIIGDYLILVLYYHIVLIDLYKPSKVSFLSTDFPGGCDGFPIKKAMFEIEKGIFFVFASFTYGVLKVDFSRKKGKIIGKYFKKMLIYSGLYTDNGLFGIGEIKNQYFVTWLTTQEKEKVYKLPPIEEFDRLTTILSVDNNTITLLGGSGKVHTLSLT